MPSHPPGKSESRVRPSPISSAPPPAASPRGPLPPITASLWAPRRIPARDCCSQLSALLQPVSWFCSFALCFGQSPFPPLPYPRYGTAPGSGPRGGRAQWVRVGPPAKTAGIAGFSRHTGDCLHWRTVGEGLLSVTRRPGTAPRPGRGGAKGQGCGVCGGLLEPRPRAEVGEHTRETKDSSLRGRAWEGEAVCDIQGVTASVRLCVSLATRALCLGTRA